MKRETLRHPKMYDLAARLDCSRPEALGYLTLFWDFTAEVATDGSIGKWPDGAIARACDWTGDPGVFIGALVESGWIDLDDTHRLLVHDWSEHCERWVSAKLAKMGRDFAAPHHSGAIHSAEQAIQTLEASKVSLEPSQVSLEASTEGSTEASAEPSLPRDQTKPNQTKPPPPTPSTEERPEAADDDDGISWDEPRRRLATVGVNNVAGALRSARENGLRPIEVLRLVETYQAAGGAWTPGALHWRISNGVTGQPPTEGWPPQEKPRSATRNVAMSPNDVRATKLIKDGRKAGKSDDEITKQLESAGLAWPA